MKTILSLLLVCGSAPLLGQTSSDVVPIVAGETRVLRGSSDITLSIYLPKSYKEAQRRFPVLYVLDPEWNAEHTVSTVHFLAANSRIPEMIVVGVSSSDRNRDFTPTEFAAAETSGGGAAFLARIEKEIIPTIDKEYRTYPMRVLVGHSLGGMFATWAFAERPRLFEAVIALDPSMWWDERAIARQFLERLPSTSGGRYIVVERAGPGAWTPDTAALRTAARGHVFALLPNGEGESHLAMPLLGTYAALRAAFADFIPDMRHDAELATPAALQTQYAERLSAEYGYPVAPPWGALQEVTQRSLNRRKAADAVRAAELAVLYYPESAAAQRALEETRKTAADLPVIPSPPPSSDVTGEAARLFAGRWTGRKEAQDGMGMHWTVTLDASGKVWKAHGIAHGVSNEGGDLRGGIPAVVVRERTIEIWSDNCCGGYIVSTLELQPDGSLRGTDAPKYIPGPPGVKPPEMKVTVSMKRIAD